MSLNSTLTGLLLITFSPSAAGQIDAALLERVRPEVLGAVKKQTGVDLAKMPIRLVKSAELAEAFAKDLGISPGKGISRNPVVRTIWNSSLAKFSWTRGEILLCPENFEKQARQVSAPELNSEAMFRAVLVHECIHAVDEQQYRWSETFRGIRDARRKAAYNAVIEGHAQLLAARICKDHGWTDGFETFKSSVTMMPPDIDELSRLTAQVAVANLGAAYNDGMRFMGYLEGKLGEKGTARAFEHPPADFEDVLHPEWYLDPSLRPARLHDLEKPLDRFAESFADDVWLSRKLTMSRPQIQAAVAMLPREDVDRILEHIKHNQVIVLTVKEAPGSRVATAGLMEFDSPQEALFYVFATDRLNRLKDEKMVEGPVRIKESRYVEILKEGWRGVYMLKTVKVGVREVQVSAVVAARGSVAVETLYNNVEVEQGKLIELSGELLGLTSVEKQEKKERKAGGKDR